MMRIIILFLFTVCLFGCNSKTNLLAPGMNKQEVVRLLGNPDSKAISGKFEVYTYKFATLSNKDFYEKIVVSFDENGILQTVRN